MRRAPASCANAAAPAPRRLLGALAALAAALAAFAPGVPGAVAGEAGLELPSGQAFEPIELLVEAQGDGAVWARARFLAPALGEGLRSDAVEADFPVLCQDWALPILAGSDTAVDQVIVSLSSRPIAFGETDAGTIQFFEAFRVEGGLCIWEGF